jgi:hypothetical protein
MQAYVRHDRHGSPSSGRRWPGSELAESDLALWGAVRPSRRPAQAQKTGLAGESETSTGALGGYWWRASSTRPSY